MKFHSNTLYVNKVKKNKLKYWKAIDITIKVDH